MMMVMMMVIPWSNICYCDTQIVKQTHTHSKHSAHAWATASLSTDAPKPLLNTKNKLFIHVVCKIFYDSISPLNMRHVYVIFNCITVSSWPSSNDSWVWIKFHKWYTTMKNKIFFYILSCVPLWSVCVRELSFHRIYTWSRTTSGAQPSQTHIYTCIIVNHTYIRTITYISNITTTFCNQKKKNKLELMHNAIAIIQNTYTKSQS